MSRFNFQPNLFLKFKPTVSTFKFELTIQKNKFIILSLIATSMSFFSSFFMKSIFLPWNLYYFYSSSLMFYIFVLAFSSTFFFSGIICSEFKKKTGFTIIPLLERHELLIGKFLANYLLNIGVAAVYYITMILFGFYFYGPPIPYTLIISFGLVMLYLLALCSVITFLSSFMPSPTSAMVLTLSMYFFGFSLIQTLIQAINPHSEPLYSFYYLFSIITESLNPELSYIDRFFIDTEMDMTFWMFPTIEAAIISFIIYFIIFFTLALYIFKKKKL